MTTRNGFWVTLTSLPSPGRLSSCCSPYGELRPGTPTAERAASKTVKCGFESHPGHHRKCKFASLGLSVSPAILRLCTALMYVVMRWLSWDAVLVSEVMSHS